MFPLTSKDKVSLVDDSYRYYKWFADYCNAHPEDEDFVKIELPLCMEMVRLLPVKIIRMKQEFGIE